MPSSNIVFVMEKLYHARQLSPHITCRWPGVKVFAILTRYLGLYEFRYPRGLKFSDFPYISDPSWQPRIFEGAPQSKVVELVNGNVRNTDLEPTDILTPSGTIWYACEPDSSGANAYHVLLRQCLGPAAAAVERPALLLYAYDTSSIEFSLDYPSSTASQEFQTMLRHGEAKRFFDYNFNVNALALFGICLRKVGVDTDRYSLSKYALQLMYALQGLQLTEGAVLRMMEHWPGTGRYAPSELGSPASRAPILEGLCSAGLLERSGRQVALSANGAALLSWLHPDCEDPDLPARLQVWQNGWPCSKERMSRYLRTFFGKQARFKPSV